MLSESDFGDQAALFSYGMHFCPTCKNLMKPFNATGQQLEFHCERCAKKHPIDFSNRFGDDTLLYSKELQAGSRKFVPDTAYIFDPTMPSVEVECPECGYNRAVYILTPDEGETKMTAVLICASATGTVAKCGHSWVLEENAELTPTKIITEQMKNLFEHFE